jgi:hypothetical protein
VQREVSPSSTCVSVSSRAEGGRVGNGDEDDVGQSEVAAGEGSAVAEGRLA